MIKNVFDEIFSTENMYMAMLEASKGRRCRPEVAEFNFNAFTQIAELRNAIYTFNYKVEKYKEFYVNEPKRRLVMAIPFHDRVVQWAIYRVINPEFVKGYIKDSYGCIPGRGSLGAMKRLKGWMVKVNRKPDKWYYLKLDISKYYYRISHEVLRKILAKKIEDKLLLAILDSIIDCESQAFGLPDGARLEDTPREERLFDVGMPIGNLLSQMFANIYLDALDQYCKRTLRIKYYIRYMDDIIILDKSKASLNKLCILISEFLKSKLRLRLNRKTCIRPISQGVEFIGYKIRASRVTVRKSTVLHMRRGIKGVLKKYSTGQLDSDRVKQVFSSIMGMLVHTDSSGLIRSIRRESVLSHSPVSEEDKDYMQYMAKMAVYYGY